MFLASALPGALVLLLLVFGLPSHAAPAVPAPQRFQWSALHGRLRGMIVAAGFLALASVPEVFVVLWATQSGMQVTWVPLVWAAASLAKMAIAMPAGMLSDRVGRLPLLLGGWTARIVVLLLLAFLQPGAVGVWLLFIAYSATLAITEPAERSLIGDHADAAGAGHGLRALSPDERVAGVARGSHVRCAVAMARVCYRVCGRSPGDQPGGGHLAAAGAPGGCRSTNLATGIIWRSGLR